MTSDESLTKHRRAALKAYFDARPRQLTSIATRAKVSPEAIRAFLKGKSVSLNQKTYDKLAAAEGVPVAVLLGEAADAIRDRVSLGAPDASEDRPKGNVGRIAPPPVRLNPGQSRRVPVMGTGKGGKPGTFSLNTGDPIDFVDRPPKLEHRTGIYCIYLEGDSMEPVHEHGDMLFVDSGRRPFPGRDALIELHPAKPGDPPDALVKRVMAVNSEFIEVMEFNPKARQFRILQRQVKNFHLILKNTDMY